METKVEQAPKAFDPMLVTFSGMTMLVKDEQPAKQRSGMVVKFEEKRIDRNPLQSWKALLPNETILSLRFNSWRAAQL